MFTVTGFLILAAGAFPIISIMGKVPLWVPVLIMWIVMLLSILPLR